MECKGNFKILVISAVLFIIIIVLSQMLLNKYEPFTDTNKGEIDDSPATKANKKDT